MTVTPPPRRPGLGRSASRKIPAQGPGTRAATTSAPAALRVRGLTVHYGDVLALDGADLTLARGQLAGLIGMNGSGKSTLLKAIMGIVRHRGSVELLGLPPAQARRAGLVGYVPQSEDVDWTFPLSVRDVVLMGRYGRMGPLRRARRSDTDAVDAALRAVGLTDLAGRQIGRLSGGQRKRAFLARALAQEAALLLLDEPFTGVDTTSEATISAVLQDVVARGGTVLLSSHDLTALAALSDQLVLLNRRVLATGPPEQVMRPEVLAQAFTGPVPVARAEERA